MAQFTIFFNITMNCAKAKICECTWGEKTAPWGCQGLTHSFILLSILYLEQYIYFLK